MDKSNCEIELVSRIRKKWRKGYIVFLFLVFLRFVTFFLCVFVCVCVYIYLCGALTCPLISLAKEPAKAAEAYENALRKHTGVKTGVPSLDLVLLGMGPDGHTCSLFPGHPLLKESKRLIAPITDSPKPPSQRITFTLPLVRAARARAFVAAGAGKADMLPKVLEDQTSQLPSSLVGPSEWFVDQPAAAKLKQATISTQASSAASGKM